MGSVEIEKLLAYRTNPSVKKGWILGDKFDARMPHHDGIKAL